ncbi:MAG: SRPBCC family protein [Nitrososphaerota archaeon]|nr:SRPBCC family protein [Nitrososphaerota archaeon]MDG6990646.1 SRPBCC family protein [Nitrososphaerota archaeon]
MRFEASVLVKASRDKVYSAYADFEAMPRWSRRAVKVTSVATEGNTARLETAPSGGGRRHVTEMKLFPPDKAESESATRFTKNHSAVTFETVPGGTRVTASLEVDFKGRWGWVMKPMGKAEAEASALAELIAFAKYVESIP